MPKNCINNSCAELPEELKNKLLKSQIPSRFQSIDSAELSTLKNQIAELTREIRDLKLLIGNVISPTVVLTGKDVTDQYRQLIVNKNEK